MDDTQLAALPMDALLALHALPTDALHALMLKAAVVLVRDRGRSQRDVYRDLYKALEAASDGLDQVPVIYNDAFGAFGVSNVFVAFVGSKLLSTGAGEPPVPGQACNVHLDRTAAARHVRSFGGLCAREHAVVAELWKVYRLSGIRAAVSAGMHINHAQMALRTIQRNLQSLDEHLAGAWMVRSLAAALASPDRPTRFSLLKRNPLWGLYDVDSLRSLRADGPKIQALVDEFTQELDTHLKSAAWAQLPPYVAADLASAIDGLLSTGAAAPPIFGHAPLHHHAGAAGAAAGAGACTLAFGDAVVHLGQECPTIWEHQAFADKNTMRVLVVLRDRFPPSYEFFRGALGDSSGGIRTGGSSDSNGGISSSGSSSDDTELGLLFASGPEAKLAIGLVPALMSWSVKDFDGKERVAVMGAGHGHHGAAQLVFH